jgi:hypothetical protein
VVITSKATRVLVTVIVATTMVALPALACELAGPNTHIGEIKAIDPAQRSLTILDRQMKKPFTFLAAPEQLKGLSPGQLVSVKYSEMKGRLMAEEIKPL